VRFGVLATSYNRAGERPAVALSRWVELAVEVEALGFWSIWGTEHRYASDPEYRPFDVPEFEYPTTDYDMSPDCLTLLSYAAAKTSTLRLGAGVSVLHWDHPLKLAERAAMVDVLSGGRLELGVGRGLGFREQEVFAVPQDPDENRRKYEEGVEIIQAAWSGERFRHEGEFFRFPELRMTPPPGRPAPLFIGSGSTDSAAYAARKGLPYATIVWPLLGVQAYKEKVEHYRSSAAEAGVDVSRQHLPHFLYMHCSETDEEAAEVAFEYMIQLQYILENHYELRRRNANLARLGHHDGQDDMTTLRKLAQFPVDEHLIGSPDTISERIGQLRDDLGLTYLVAIAGFGNMPPELSRPSLRRFAQQVLPRFQQIQVAGVQHGA